MTAVRFQRRGDRYAIRFNYNADLVDLLKTSIPSFARSYDPATKTWTAERFYAEQFAADLRELGITVVGLQQRAQQCHADDAGWARSLFSAVGPTRRGPVFRSLCKVLHPDVATGDTQLMRELIKAHTELDDRKESA